MLVGKVLRSPHPHARIKSINLDKAAALPGVKAVMTGKDLVEFPWDKPAILGIQDLRFNSRNVMARDKALYAGPRGGGGRRHVGQASRLEPSS